ncbi:MAG: amidase [Gemmatimonadaceae bacterium]|nr:amidase [Gemmatimonadaceae bacterium]
MPPPFPSLRELVQAVVRRRVSPTEVVQESLAAIAREQERLNAFITVRAESALAGARAIERRLARRLDPGALAGVPLAVKDLLLTNDAPTTAGSRRYGEGIPPSPDATVVARMRRAGAIIVGKANLHELALGVTTVNEHFGPARNPWDSTRVSGGSSGGSAVAVAADLCPAAIGTDTRGSIRIPASCCGITGFKPTYGLVPVDGVIPLAASLDHVGPMARSADDCALLLSAMLTGSRRVKIAGAARGSARRFVVGISEYHLRDLDGAVARAIDAALLDLRPLVKDLRSVRIPGLEVAQAASVVIGSSEAVAYHDEALRAQPESIGPLVRQRLAGGYQRTALEYVQAMQARVAVKTAFAAVFADVDLLVGATLPAVPARIEDQHVLVNGAAENVIEASTRLNAAQNVAGIPAISAPAGEAGGMPVGMQIIGPAGADARVLALAGTWQRATDWHERRPGRTP